MVIIGKLSNRHKSAIQFFADNLISKQMQRHIILHFVFREKIDCLGITSINDYNRKNEPRDFVIEVNRNQGKEEILKTFAHELVHVKQYIYKELNDDSSLWCGEKFDADKIPYDEQPWEIEAESVAYMLYEGYKNGYV